MKLKGTCCLEGKLWQTSVHFSSVAQSCPTLCNPMNCSTSGLPVYHQLPEFTQTHVHRVGDAIQPSHPLSSPSPSAFNLSQHQGLFKWISSLLFNTLSSLVIAFLPRSKHLLISWLQSPSTVILEPRKIVCHCLHSFPNLFAMKLWNQMPWSKLFECWVLSQLKWDGWIALVYSLEFIHYCTSNSPIMR